MKKVLMMVAVVCLLAACCSTEKVKEVFAECPTECLEAGAAKLTAELRAMEHPCEVAAGDVWVDIHDDGNPYETFKFRMEIIEVSGKYVLYRFCSTRKSDPEMCGSEPNSTEISKICRFYKKEEKKEAPK